MRTTPIILLLTGLLQMTAKEAFSQKSVRLAVFTLDGAVLKKNKSRIINKEEEVMPAYRQLLKDADKALSFGPVSVMEKIYLPPSGNPHDYMSLAPYHWPDPSKPDGLPYIRKDGQTNPEVRDYKDKEYMPKLCDAVHTLGLAYYFSGEKKYAQHATRLLRVWFLDTATRMNPHLNYGQAIKGVTTGRGAGLIDSRHFIKVIDGIGLLKNSGEWKEADQEGMKNWFSSFLDWMQTSPIGLDEMDAPNNHGAWYDAQRLSMALFTGNGQHANEIIASAKKRLDKQMDEAGSFPKEMERTISLHYTVFVMEAFFLIAEMADKVEAGLWNYVTPSGKSLRKAFNVLMPYLVKEMEWTGTQIKPFEFEDGYKLLLSAAREWNCGKCVDGLRFVAGEKSDRIREKLLYYSTY